MEDSDFTAMVNTMELTAAAELCIAEGDKHSCDDPDCPIPAVVSILRDILAARGALPQTSYISLLLDPLLMAIMQAPQSTAKLLSLLVNIADSAAAGNLLGVTVHQTQTEENKEE